MPGAGSVLLGAAGFFMVALIICGPECRRRAGRDERWEQPHRRRHDSDVQAP